MRYGKIYESFWDDGDIQPLSDQGKILAAYALTCRHRNMIGCFRLPLEYVCADLRWQPDAAKNAIKEVIATGFVRYDAIFKWVIIPQFLEWNEIENPNQSRAALKLLEAVPQKSATFPLIIQAVAKQLGQYPNRFPEDFRAGFRALTVGATLPEGLSQGLETPDAGLPESGTGTGAGTGTGKKQRGAKKGTRIPEDFAVTDKHRELAREHGVDADRELPAFIDHFKAKAGADGSKLDWDATFRNWLRNAARFANKAKPPAQPVAAPEVKRAPAPPVTLPGDINRTQGQKAWELITQKVKPQIDQRAFRTWLEPLKPLGVSGAVLYMGMPHPDFAVVKQEFGEVIGVAAEQCGLSRIEYVITGVPK